MTPPINTNDLRSKKLESLMENGFVIVAFSIFLFAMITTLTKTSHDSVANEGHEHGSSEAAAPSHH